MPDVFTKSKRSEVMARIRSRGNRDTELALVRLLRAYKISGWRRHVRVCATVDRSKLRVDGRKVEPGRARSPLRAGARSRRHGAHGVARPTFQVRPDFVFPQLKLAVFVDGCFWHGCPRHATQPKQNAAFWRRKLAGNQRRDALVTRTLRRAGWRVVRIWEHELRKSGILLRARLRRTRRQPAGLKNLHPSTFNLQPRTSVVRRIQRALRPRRRPD